MVDRTSKAEKKKQGPEENDKKKMQLGEIKHISATGLEALSNRQF